MSHLKKWYVQILVGVVLVFVISYLNHAAYPENLYRTNQDIVDYGDSRLFYILALFAWVAQILIVVGIIRGFLAMIRKFRDFVRIGK